VIHIIIKDADGNDVVSGKFKTIEAIHQLQRAIDDIRRRAAPVFDPSFGEQPQPLLAPSESELQSFINR
jgi:hypothetical protein